MTEMNPLENIGSSDLRKGVQWIGLIAFAIFLASILGLIHFPAAPLLGAMIAGIAFGASGSPIRVPRPAYLLAQGAAGVFIATSMSPAIFVDAVQEWPLLVALTIATLTVAFSIGWIMNRTTGISEDVAVYGSLPGMSGAMVIIANERGADARIVALMQYVRLAAVIVSVALFASFLPDSQIAQMPDREISPLSPIVTPALAALALVAVRIKVLPAAGMLIPMIIGATIEATGWMHLQMPHLMILATFGIIGLEVGLKFTRDVLGHVLRLVPAVLLSSLALIVLSAGLGLVLMAVTDLDMKTALLAAAPGSIETVALVAIATKANVAAVLAFQTVRMFTVVLLGPFIVDQLMRLPIWNKCAPSRSET
ncbi:AbrB family transcriptional regulator [Celeribacter litoreus]|uniref:AbrB family transcriptional regulator n=1 Tax=Celeribacter litoreus TaxID=2876714 RepID=UPI001CCBC9CC|nr:AbrB family transcriptional regulator [Celeribacter litoreus]MCA0042483.1 AbrB family transcriptional regulator [Celeribacter litoreus]